MLIARTCADRIPEWEAFFDRLGAEIAVDSGTHRSVLTRLIDEYGGEAQKQSAPLETNVIYEHDLVPSITAPGLPVSNPGERDALHF